MQANAAQRARTSSERLAAPYLPKMGAGMRGARICKHKSASAQRCAHACDTRVCMARALRSAAVSSVPPEEQMTMMGVFCRVGCSSAATASDLCKASSARAWRACAPSCRPRAR